MTRDRGDSPDALWKRYQSPHRARFERIRQRRKPVAPPEHRKAHTRSVVMLRPSAPTTAPAKSLLVPAREARRVEGLSWWGLYRQNLQRRAWPWREDLQGWWSQLDGGIWNAMGVGAGLAFIAGVLISPMSPWLALTLMPICALLSIPVWSAWSQTRRQVKLLNDGVRRKAWVRRIEVPRHGGATALVTFVYNDFNGRRRTHTERLARHELGGSLTHQARLDVLIHEEVPGAIAPYLHSVTFAEPPPEAKLPPASSAQEGEPEDEPELSLSQGSSPYEDLRCESPRAQGQGSPAPQWPPVARRVALRDRAHDGSLRSWYRRLRGHDLIGELFVDEAGLQWKLEDAQARLSWERPWIVHPSVRLLAQGQAELNLTLRASHLHSEGVVHDRPAIRVKAVVSQHQVSLVVPVKWEACPYIDTDDLTWLWPLVQHHAALQGQPRHPIVLTHPSPKT